MDDPHRILDELIARGLPDGLASEDRPSRYSDDALALRFTERRGADLRYVATRGTLVDLEWQALGYR